MSGSETKGEPEDRGFVVIDKRQSASEGAESQGSGSEANAAAGEEAPPRARELPKVDFATFAISLGSSAMLHLGLVADPETGKPQEPDLQMARHIIDTLEMLQGKTQGNLESGEQELLQSLLTELRMRFVEAGRK